MSHRCAPPTQKNENDGKQSFNKSNKKQMVLAIPNGIIESGFEYSVLTVNSFKYLAGGGGDSSKVIKCTFFLLFTTHLGLRERSGPSQLHCVSDLNKQIKEPKIYIDLNHVDES